MYEGRGGGRKPQRTAGRGGAGRRARGGEEAWSLAPVPPRPCRARSPWRPPCCALLPLSWAPHTGLSPGAQPGGRGNPAGSPCEPQAPGSPPQACVRVTAGTRQQGSPLGPSPPTPALNTALEIPYLKIRPSDPDPPLLQPLPCPHACPCPGCSRSPRPPSHSPASALLLLEAPGSCCPRAFALCGTHLPRLPPTGPSAASHLCLNVTIWGLSKDIAEPGGKPGSGAQSLCRPGTYTRTYTHTYTRTYTRSPGRKVWPLSAAQKQERGRRDKTGEGEEGQSPGDGSQAGLRCMNRTWREKRQLLLRKACAGPRGAPEAARGGRGATTQSPGQRGAEGRRGVCSRQGAWPGYLLPEGRAPRACRAKGPEDDTFTPPPRNLPSRPPTSTLSLSQVVSLPKAAPQRPDVGHSSPEHRLRPPGPAPHGHRSPAHRRS